MHEASSKHTSRIAEMIAAGLHFILLITVTVYWGRNPQSRFKTTQTIQAISATPTTEAALGPLVNQENTSSVQQALLSIPTTSIFPYIAQEQFGYNSLEVCYTLPPTQTIQWGSSQSYQTIPQLQPAFTLHKWPLIFIFTLVTFVAHAYRAAYIDDIWAYIYHNYPRTDRWLEYAISSPLMIILIAASAGTLDWGQIMLLAASQAVLVMLGLAVEVFFTLGQNQGNQPSSSAAPQTFYSNMPYNAPLRLNISNYSTASQTVENRAPNVPKISFISLAWLFTALAWILFVMQWAIIWVNLTDLLSDFQCLNDKSLTSRTQIPIIIVSAEFLFFLVFGVWQLVALVGTESMCLQNYTSFGVTSNYGYIALSLSAKVLLAVLLIVEAETLKMH